MADIFYDGDVTFTFLGQRKIAVIGYTPVARSQALNLRDSGVPVTVGLPADAELTEKAIEDGFTVKAPAVAAGEADVVALLVEKDEQETAFAEVSDSLTAGKTLVMTAGFNLHYGILSVPQGVSAVVISPQSTACALRKEFMNGRGVPALVAVHTDASGNALELAKAYAVALGAGRAGIIKSTVAEIVETGLFNEQAVLGGGLQELIAIGFETMVQAGYQPEVAYIRLADYLRKIASSIAHRGGVDDIAGNNIAEFGVLTGGARVIDANVAQNMQAVLNDIKTGAFAENYKANKSEIANLKAKAETRPIKSFAQEINKLFP